MIKKKNIALGVLVLCFIVGFDSLALTPLFAQSLFLGLGLSTIGYLLMLFYYRRFPRPIRFFGLLFLALFAQSVLATNRIYGQALNEGVIVSSALYLPGIIFLIYYLCMRYRVNVDEITKVIINLAWLGFASLFFLYITDTSFAGSDDKEFGVQSLRKGIITLAATLYLFKYFKQEKIHLLLISLVFFSVNHWVDFQRITFFLTLLVIAIMIYHFRERTPGIKLLLAVLVFIPLFSIFLSSSNLGQEITTKISNAFELFESDRESYSEASVESRIVQTDYAMNSIKEYPFTGVGRIKYDNIEEITGLNYFYISDIGLIGVVFSYGLLGIIALVFQYSYWIRNFFRKRFTEIDGITGYKLYMIFLLIHTLLSGISINTPAEFLILVTVIEVGKFQYEKVKIDE